jgi:hypothetical protein
MSSQSTNFGWRSRQHYFRQRRTRTFASLVLALLPIPRLGHIGTSTRLHVPIAKIAEVVCIHFLATVPVLAGTKKFQEPAVGNVRRHANGNVVSGGIIHCKCASTHEIVSHSIEPCNEVLCRLSQKTHSNYHKTQ